MAHYDMIFAKPLDEEIISEVAALGCPVITVEDGTVDGGMGSAVADRLAGMGHTATVHRMGIPDRFIPQGTPAQLRAMCGFDSESIYNKIVEFARR